MKNAIVLLTALFFIYHYYHFMREEWRCKREMEKRRRRYPQPKVHYLQKKYKN